MNHPPPVDMVLSVSKAKLDQDRWRARTQLTTDVCRRPESAPMRTLAGVGRNSQAHLPMQKQENSMLYSVQTLSFHTGDGGGVPSQTVSRHPMRAYYDAARQRHYALRTISSPVVLTPGNSSSDVQSRSTYGVLLPTSVGLMSQRSRCNSSIRCNTATSLQHIERWTGKALPDQRPRRIRAARVESDADAYHKKKPAARAEPQRLRAARSAPELKHQMPNTMLTGDRLNSEPFLTYVAEKNKLRHI